MNELIVDASLRELTEEETVQIRGGETAIGANTYQGQNLSNYSFWYQYQAQLIFSQIGGVR